jgi:hypothetical protein
MAGIKISNLPAASTLGGTEQFAIVQSNITKAARMCDITALVGTSFLSSTCNIPLTGVFTTVNANSATWSGVYNDWKSLSGSYVRTTQCNTFCAKQIFSEIEVETLEAGYQVNAAGACSSVLGGYYNDACGGGSAVVAGNNNDVFGNFATIAAGQNNVITSLGTNGFIAGGASNTVKHSNSVAMGTCTTSVSSNMLHVSRLYANALPTANPMLAGVIWSNNGALSVG